MANEEELVRPAWACPKCKERRMDRLILSECVEDVTCGACGHVYQLESLVSA